MECQRLFDAIAFQKVPPNQHFLEEILRQIFALQQQAEQLFIKLRIFQCRQQLCRRRLVNQPDEIVAGGVAQLVGAAQLRAPSPLATSRSAIRAAVSAASTETTLIVAFGSLTRS